MEGFFKIGCPVLGFRIRREIFGLGPWESRLGGLACRIQNLWTKDGFQE